MKPTEVQQISRFSFSKTSLKRLEGVDDRLVKVTTTALTKYAQVDFGVSSGVRTIEEQRQLVASGKSTTMESKHLTGDAVDLYPYYDGKAHWDVESYQDLVMAMKQAAQEHNVKIKWGGSWQPLEEIDDVVEAVNKYKELRISQGRQPFVDCPHFELME